MSLNADDFPNHWRVVPIDHVAFFQEGPGVRTHQYTESGVKLLNGSNINGGFLDLSKTDRYISDSEAFGKYKHFLVEPGDLLIACSGVVVDKFEGKIAYAEEEHLPLCMNTSTMRFRSLNEDVLYLDYFRRFLQTSFFKTQLQKLITGSAQLNFGPSHIKQMVVPLPPLPEQKRIAAILDKADAIRRKRQQATQLADDFLRAVFLDMFGDPVTNPKGWDVKRIEEVAAKDKYAIKAGPFGSALKKEDYVPEGYKIYGQEQVIRDDLEYGDYFINEEKYESLASCSVSEGDVLISLVGSFGKVSVVPKDYHPGIINPRLMKIRFNESCASPWYMKYLLTTKEMIRKIEGMSHGGTMGILNVGKIRDLEVINPPLNLQESFLKISTQVRSLKARCELVAAHPLFDSLSQKAFSGQL